MLSNLNHETKKGKASTSKQIKQPEKRLMKTTMKTTKQNTRKWPASDDSDSDAESNNGCPKQKKPTKNRPVEEVDEENGMTEHEQVVESDVDEDVQTGEKSETNDEVSKSAASYRN